MARDQQPLEIMSVYNGHLMTLCSVPVLLLHRHHTAVSAVLCRTSHKDVADWGMAWHWQSPSKVCNWIIADWALGDMRGAELSGGCGFQYHGTARRRVLCNVLWAPGLCRHHIRCLATDRSGLCRLSWSVSDHQCFTGTRKTGGSPSLSTISFKCLQYSAVQCVMYDVFFSLGSLVISFWMLLLPSQPCVPDVMSNGCVY